MRLSAQIRGGGVFRTVGHQGGRRAGSRLRGDDPRRSTWSATFTASARRWSELLGIVAKAPRLSGDTTRRCPHSEKQKIVQRLAAKFRVDELELRRRLTALRRRRRQSRGRRSSLGARSTRPPATDAADSRMPVASGDRSVAAGVAGIAGRASRVHRGDAEPNRRRWHVGRRPCRRIYETCCRLADEGVCPRSTG